MSTSTDAELAKALSEMPAQAREVLREAVLSLAGAAAPRRFRLYARRQCRLLRQGRSRRAKSSSGRCCCASGNRPSTGSAGAFKCATSAPVGRPDAVCPEVSPVARIPSAIIISSGTRQQCWPVLAYNRPSASGAVGQFTGERLKNAGSVPTTSKGPRTDGLDRYDGDAGCGPAWEEGGRGTPVGRKLPQMARGAGVRVGWGRQEHQPPTLSPPSPCYVPCS